MQFQKTLIPGYSPQPAWPEPAKLIHDRESTVAEPLKCHDHRAPRRQFLRPALRPTRNRPIISSSRTNPGNPGDEPCGSYEESRRSWKWRREGSGGEGAVGRLG